LGEFSANWKVYTFKSSEGVGEATFERNTNQMKASITTVNCPKNLEALTGNSMIIEHTNKDVICYNHCV